MCLTARTPPAWQGKPPESLPEYEGRLPRLPFTTKRRRCGACNAVWVELDRPCPACAAAKAKAKRRKAAQ